MGHHTQSPPPSESERIAAAAGRRYAPAWLRQAVLERDGFRCRYCGCPVTNETANIDHVKPWPFSLTLLENLRTSCRPCNHAKGSYQGRKHPNPGRGWYRYGRRLQEKHARAAR